MIGIPDVVTIDFETGAIKPRPKYPPIPVGVSIRYINNDSKYYAWGHPTGNNCSYGQAKSLLKAIFDSSLQLLFHNSKFDVDVAVTHMDCKMPSWDRIHDTMYLLFLMDPHSKTLALKPSSENLLGISSDERNKVQEWVFDNKLARRGSTKWGEFICMAPGDLVGEYAMGDTDRTFKLFDLLYPKVCESGMLGAYNVERELMPILLENEIEGIRVARERLEYDFNLYTKNIELVEGYIRVKLGGDNINIDSDVELSNKLDSLGIVTDWALTPTGKRSTAKDNLTIDMFNDKDLACALGYRGRLMTCMSTFMSNWLEMSGDSGRIHTNWNQVRSERSGSRTGRMSSNPNFMNIPTDFYGKDDGYIHPTCIPGLRELPNMRDYILPDDGCVWLNRDYSQQEPRILAHFEGGDLKDKYILDPTMDIHQYVADKIKEMYGVSLHRKLTKIINLGIIYGKGSGLLAKELNVSVKEAREFKVIHAKTFPGIKELESDIKRIAKAGDCITTWAGRRYYCEDPVLDKKTGRLMTFEYKLLNYLIQGSAADCTKQSIINYHKNKEHGRFLVAVHDENNVSVPLEYCLNEMEILKESMNGVDFGVPILSDGKIGVNWGNLKDFKD